MTTIVKSFWSLLAEREGFEPPVPLGTTVFKTVVIDHSTISPEGVICSQPASLLKASAKLWIIIETAKYLKEKFHKKWFSLWLGCISCALYRIFNGILMCLKQRRGCIPCAVGSNFHVIRMYLRQRKGSNFHAILTCIKQRKGWISCALYRIFNAILTCIKQRRGYISCALDRDFHAILTCIKQSDNTKNFIKWTS